MVSCSSKDMRMRTLVRPALDVSAQKRARGKHSP